MSGGGGRNKILVYLVCKAWVFSKQLSFYSLSKVFKHWVHQFRHVFLENMSWLWNQHGQHEEPSRSSDVPLCCNLRVGSIIQQYSVVIFPNLWV
jgi:hypothetical protein